MATSSAPTARAGASEEGLGAPFVRFIAAVAISFYGDWFSTVALAVAVYTLSPGPVAPAIFTLARLAPRLVASPLGGRLADRVNPGVLLAVVSLVQAVLAVGLVAAVVRGSLLTIDALVAGSCFLGALARPANMPILTRLVPDRERPRANAFYGSTFSLSLAVAPAIAAPAVALAGPRLLLLLDAASFIVAAALILTLPCRSHGDAATSTTQRRTPAVRMVLADPFLRLVAAGGFAGGLAATAAQAVLVVASADRFGGESRVGLLYAAVGGGALLGTLLSPRLRPASVSRATIAGFALVEVVTLAAVGVAPSLVPALLALAASGAAAGMYQVWAATEVQRRVAVEHIGRVSAATLSALYCGWLLGAGLGVALGGRVHWDGILLLACGVGAAAVAAAFAPTSRVSGRTRTSPSCRGGLDPQRRGA